LPASIFLSYASEDRGPARSIGSALAQLGIDVWLDESELGGGDAWDQKIRKQIRECDFFMPIVSARTEARHEGYFRREWRLAVERTLDMADDHLFLLPVVIDDTDQSRARVPEKFLAVQWLRLPEGQPNAALEALCRRILGGAPPATEPKTPEARKPVLRESGTGSKRPRPPPAPYPPFPHEEPGQRVRFWAHIIGWLARCLAQSVMRLPRWLRITLYIWVGILVMSRACTPGSDRSEVSHSDARQIKAITDAYRGSSNPKDIAKLGAQIAKELSDSDGDSAEHRAVLAIPFGAPAGDSSAEKLADSAFAQTYGRLSVTHRGQIGLDKNALSTNDAAEALARARTNHSTYVIYGAVRTLAQGAPPILTVTVARVEDGTVIWTESYPGVGADAAKIAEQVNAQVPAIASDDE